MTAYYNENDPYPAQWLRNLQAANQLPKGYVDERSIAEIKAKDIDGHQHCHFFAGIGGWPLALRLAGWPDNRPVWTGSCPCQPFSVAGRRRGDEDRRHLWPAWRELIRQCRPATCFGEQIASADGRLWLAGVRADLEALGYAVGCADLCAAGVGAPHLRQRLYWVADAANPDRRAGEPTGKETAIGSEKTADAPRRSATGGLADSKGGDRGLSIQRWKSSEKGSKSERRGETCGLGDWGGFETIPLADGTIRRIESGVFPLADGVPRRVGRLRAYGNAIAPRLAAEFIAAFMETA